MPPVEAQLRINALPTHGHITEHGAQWEPGLRRSYEDALACDDSLRWSAAVVALLAPPPEADAVIVDVEAHGGAGGGVSVSEEAVADDGASDDTVDQEEAEEAAVARVVWGDAVVEAVLEEVKAKLALLRFEGSPKGRGRSGAACRGRHWQRLLSRPRGRAPDARAPATVT